MFKKKKKEKQVPKRKEKKKSILPVAFLLGLIVAVAANIAMINIEKNILSGYEKISVYVTNKAVPKNELINESNVGQYFVTKDVDKMFIPDAAITDISSLYGKASSFDMGKGMILTENMFFSIDETIAEMSNPQIVGISVSDIAQMATGMIRGGDRIDIHIISSSLKNSSMANQEDDAFTYKNVYVYEVFDSTGVKIKNSDTTTACARMNILLEEEYVSQFCETIRLGDIYITKVTE